MNENKKRIQDISVDSRTEVSFYYADYCPGKEILNVGSSLTIEFELNVDELRKAIYKAYERCESMRARLVYDEKEKQWYQYIVDKEDREIEYVDFTGKTMEEAEAEMTAWTRVPFGQDEPMNKIVIIKTPDGFRECTLWATIDSLTHSR